MKDIEELIENYFDIDYLANTCKIHVKFIEQFKKEMLQLLLPWRTYFDNPPKKHVDIIFLKDQYWIYESELEATLPKEEK